MCLQAGKKILFETGNNFLSWGFQIYSLLKIEYWNFDDIWFVSIAYLMKYLRNCWFGFFFFFFDAFLEFPTRLTSFKPVKSPSVPQFGGNNTLLVLMIFCLKTHIDHLSIRSGPRFKNLKVIFFWSEEGLSSRFSTRRTHQSCSRVVIGLLWVVVDDVLGGWSVVDLMRGW